MTKFQPRDYIAVLVIVVLAAFKLTNHNGSLDIAVALIIGYYFGRRDDPTLHIDTKLAKDVRDVEINQKP